MSPGTLRCTSGTRSAPGTLATGSAIVPSAFSRHTERALLIAISGPDQGRSWILSPRTITLGTGPDNDVRLQDGLVSRRHLRGHWTGSFLALEDLGSRNGSYAGSVRFERVHLGLGGYVRVGVTTLKLVPEEVPLSPEEPAGATGLIGSSPAMGRVHGMIAQVADSDASVLILGETGTGKELIAEELHRRSRRASRPFIVVDCGTVPGELIESVLFGHLRGAFTGASCDRRGLFAEADGGTIFLDEIGELSPQLQPALLRAVDRRMIRPVGASSYQRVDVRVLAATHRNLREMVLAGTFREDLFYRLSVVCLTLPPLRERPEDLERLARHFLALSGRPEVTLSREALEVLQEYSWPGNVRELRNVIAGALPGLGHAGEIEPQHLSLWPDDSNPYERSGAPGDGVPAGAARATTDPAVPRPDAAVQVSRAPDELLPYREAKAHMVEEFERAYISRLIARYGNVTAAARAAGMDRKHLRLLLRRYQLR
jgi:transcriptional regulator with GAF, ATPase, and Fis domain